MSNFILTPAWQTDLPAITKLVLISLADQASDDGLCWPSVESLVIRTGLSERTVFRHLNDLEEAGHIHREQQIGRSTHYYVHPCQPVTPVTVTPLSESHPTPVTQSPTPVTVTPTPATGGSQNHQEPSENHQRTISRATASRLPADWSPSIADVAYLKANREDLNVSDVEENFRDYWIAQAGAKGRKADWAATWRTWVRNEKRISHRDGLFGNNQPREKTRHEKLSDHIAKLTGKDRQQPDDQGVIHGTAERLD